MENKKTFGAYVLQRRRELGMTQKELAEKLYVTESAVSKWERGLSYPDITILQNLCVILQVTEHELLTGSEDTSRRVSEKLAQKYRKLTRNYRITQYVIYGMILLGCGIGNLASSHTLDWFFIAAAGVLMAASLTLVPALAALDPRFENYQLPLAFGSFTFFLEILLLICCIYSGGTWFWIAGTAVLFGFALVFLPFLLPFLPLPPAMANRKTSVYLLTVTGLLILLLLASCLSAGETWFPVAAISVIFGLSLFIMPVLLYQLPLSQWMGERKISMYLLIETGLLLFLLLVCDLNDQGSWFFTAALGILLVLCLIFLPIILRQTLRDLPLYRHKSLLYLSAETVFLLLLLFLRATSQADMLACPFGDCRRGLRPVTALQDGNLRSFWTLSLPNALLFLVLPWGVMAVLRYLPVNRWLRAAAAFAWMGLWIWLAPAGFDQIMIPVYGQPDKPYSLIIPFDFTKWELPYNAWNGIMIILLVLGAAALLCGCMGLRAMKKRKNT